MSYDKGIFDTPEFRELLKRYEQMKRQGVCSYFETHELCDIHSYYLYNGKSQEAADVFKLAQQLHHGSPDIVKMEIRAMLTFGKPEAALHMFNEIEYDTDDDTLLLKAEVLLAMKQYKASRSIARSILHKSSIIDDISYDAMEIMLDCGYAQEVLENADNGLKKHPGNKNLLEVKAESLIELQRTDEAIALYDYLLDKNPYSTFYWEQLGHIYFMIGRYGKSIECFEYELTIDKSIEYACMMQGYCYYHLGCYEKAMEIFDSFIGADTQNIIPRFYKALSQARIGMYEESIAELHNAYEIGQAERSDNIECMLCMINEAILHFDKGNVKEAQNCMSNAVFHHADTDSMKQLLLGGTPFFELYDKENMTFHDINRTETREWKGYELMYEFGCKLMENGYGALALYPLYSAQAIAPDCADIDASIAYILYKEGGDNKEIKTLIDNALEGKSNRLFKLFGVKYDYEISSAAFMKKVGL